MNNYGKNCVGPFIYPLTLPMQVPNTPLFGAKGALNAVASLHALPFTIIYPHKTVQGNTCQSNTANEGGT